MLEELRKQVYEANMMLYKYGLAKLTWGNVSGIDRKNDLVVIKPSGIPYEQLSPENMVVVNMEGDVVEGNLYPSTDTPTHLALYQSFNGISSVTYTQSKYATIWAQAGLDIPAFGTAHADYFYGDIPCTLPMADVQINGEYEKQTGFQISDTFATRRLNPMDVPACLVSSMGPFAWGKSPAEAVENALVLEYIAEMALHTMNFEFGLSHIPQALMDKHFLRRNGLGAYYGQHEALVTEVTENDNSKKMLEEEIMEIRPSNHTVELQRIYEIEDAVMPEPAPERPGFNRIPSPEPEEIVLASISSEDFPAQPTAPKSGMNTVSARSNASYAPERPGFNRIPTPEPEEIVLASISSEDFPSKPAASKSAMNTASTPPAEAPAPKKPMDFTF